MATKKTNKFLDLIQTQRSKKKKQKFKGSLLDYLDLVKDDPSIAKLSHKRLYTAITDHVVEIMPESYSRKNKATQCRHHCVSPAHCTIFRTTRSQA